MMAHSIDWQALAVMATIGQPLLSFLAIAAAILAAVLTPQLAARIEQRRWRSTAQRLATMLYEAIDAVAVRLGAPSEQAVDDLQRTSDTLTLAALVLEAISRLRDRAHVELNLLRRSLGHRIDV